MAVGAPRARPARPSPSPQEARDGLSPRTLSCLLPREPFSLLPTFFFLNLGKEKGVEAT